MNKYIIGLIYCHINYWQTKWSHDDILSTDSVLLYANRVSKTLEKLFVLIRLDDPLLQTNINFMKPIQTCLTGVNLTITKGKWADHRTIYNLQLFLDSVVDSQKCHPTANIRHTDLIWQFFWGYLKCSMLHTSCQFVYRSICTLCFSPQW